MNEYGLDGAISAVVVLSAAIAIAAIAVVVAACGADGGCTIAGVGTETRHLGMVTTAIGLLISVVALSGRSGTRTRPIHRRPGDGIEGRRVSRVLDGHSDLG